MDNEVGKVIFVDLLPRALADGCWRLLLPDDLRVVAGHEFAKPRGVGGSGSEQVAHLLEVGEVPGRRVERPSRQ